MDRRGSSLSGMLRRSPRLQETGYYSEDETPAISYKEILRKRFRRKIGHRNDKRHTNLVTQNMQHNHGIVEKAVSSFSVKHVSRFLLILLLSIGITHMQFQLMKLQQEVQLLRQQTDFFGRFYPLADTMANYALESQGARIVEDLSSDTYWPHGCTGALWDTICHWLYPSEAQRRVIQGQTSLQPGQCWCFSGARGRLFISLSHSVCISHVTLGHITKRQSPDGYIGSAPRNFSVYGMSSPYEEGTCLGELVYNQDGPEFQTFELSCQGNCVFRYVKLQIESNWGKTDHTCLYSFRVHGKLPVYVDS